MGLNLGLAAEDIDVVSVSILKILREEEITPARAGLCFYKRTLPDGWPGLACLVRELHHEAWVPFSMSDIQSTSQNGVYPTPQGHGAREAAAVCSRHCSELSQEPKPHMPVAVQDCTSLPVWHLQEKGMAGSQHLCISHGPLIF